MPFQFSLHVLGESGDLKHHGLMDRSSDDPFHACAQLLVDLCGGHGSGFAYNAGFECRVMRELAVRFPEFAPALESIIERVVDLLPIAVVQDSGMAVSAFIEAVDPATLAERKTEIQNQFFSYCQFDTFAMERIWQFFRGSRGEDLK